ncbi:mitochondrial thiamine pyrophosphate transporter [Dispira simplex]|nr:mitochondrial thiamine pyrophosphate transporter [Dispira simplex]
MVITNDFFPFQKTFLGHQLPQTMVSFASGFVTGIVATMCTYPFDLLRTRFAAQGDVKVYRGLFDSIRAISKSEGIQGFYRGMWPSLVQIMPYISLMFGTYDLSARWFQEAEERSTLIHYLGPFQDIICGGIAGTVGKLGVFPLDVVRKRLQVQGPSRKLFARDQVPVYSSSVWRTLREIALHEGILGLYRGLVPGLVKSAPASAITFFIYGQMQHACDEYNKRNPK